MRFTLTRAPAEGGAAEGEAGPAPRELRQQGDNCRDRGLWAEAARHYRRYLEAEAEDAAIWVQLGHCLKESGAYREADQAYDRALALTPNDDDIYLHKGHLAKLTGSPGDAVYFYKKSLALRQDDNDALRELLAMGAVEDISHVIPSYTEPHDAAARTLYFDVSDFIEYATKNLSLSGIQRVVGNLARFSATAAFEQPTKVILFVYDEISRQMFEVRRSLLLSMVGQLEESNSDRGVLDSTIKAVFASRELVNPEPGDMIVIAGAFWVFPGYDLIARLRSQGVQFGVFIHDLIQIRQPEYVHREATLEFRKALIDVLVLADFALTNSEFVAGEVREFLDQRLNFSLPVKAVPLATELPRAQGRRHIIAPEILDIGNDEFVLCVCTIEVRKNHMYLVRIWERLKKEFDGAIPRLVFVGKWGWDIEAFREYLDKSDCLGNWLFIFIYRPDSALDYLYRRCLFTVFPSLAEGWGLPVGESLAHGKPCAASNATSIPEVGGNLVRYFDPLDPAQGYAAIKELLSDRPALEEWTQQVRSSFRPRTWQTFGDEFFAAIGGLWDRPSGGSAINLALPAGEIIFGGHDDVIRIDSYGYKLLTFRMARAGGWHPMEGWGVWASQRRARLRFHTDLAEGETIKLYLLLSLPSNAEGAKCAVKAGAEDAVFDRLSEQPRFCQATGRIGGRGLVEIELISNGDFPPEDSGRQLYVGLTALAFCPDGDTAARVQLLEKVQQAVQWYW